MYNAQKAEYVGESECSYVIQEIGVQTLPHPKGGRFPTRINYMKELKTVEYSCAVTPQVRQTGNRLSGLAGTAYANLLA